VVITITGAIGRTVTYICAEAGKYTPNKMMENSITLTKVFFMIEML
jgi:hypothetical protein